MTSSTRFLTALLTTLLFAGTAAARQDTLTLSRARCVEIALSENPTIKVADMEAKRMVYARRATTGSLYPSIDFQGAYQRAIELQTVSMNMGGQSQQFKMGTDNVWSFGFNAAMPLVNASLWKAIQISDTQIMASLEEARGSRLDMVNNVNKAYYSWLLAIASRDVVRANYDVALTNADIFRKQFDAGVRVLEKLIETGIASGEFYCENPKGAASNIMYVLEGMKINAQTFGISEKKVDEQLLYIMEGLIID